jgi:hypothetical protein
VSEPVDGRDPFVRWIKRTPPSTQYLAMVVRESLVPAIESRGFSRTLFLDVDRGWKTDPFELLFERQHGLGRQMIGVQFEKRGRALLAINIVESPDGGWTSQSRQARLVRIQAGTFRAWYGLHTWRLLLLVQSAAGQQKRIADDIHLAQRHLPQVFAYLEQGTVGPNIRLSPAIKVAATLRS